MSVCVHTFITAQLNICKQSYLDNLPEEAEHQVRFSLLQVLSSDIDDLAADGRGWVQSQVQILLLGENRCSKSGGNNLKSDDRGSNEVIDIHVYGIY